MMVEPLVLLRIRGMMVVVTDILLGMVTLLVVVVELDLLEQTVLAKECQETVVLVEHPQLLVLR